MNSFTIEPVIEFPLVTFYTVKKDAERLTEVLKFAETYASDEEFQDEYLDIQMLLKLMGTEETASETFFRPENAAEALPPRMIQYHGNRLRLYCIRINSHIVILFNGGVKTARTAQESPSLAVKFRDAQTFAGKIWQEIKEGMILVNESQHKLTNPDGSEDIIIL